MGRPPIPDGMAQRKRGPWSPEEDIMLASYIQEHGPGNWRLVPTNAGLQRCGKSCRLRWKNYLRPGIKRGNFTPAEDRLIIRYQALFGNRWAAIAAHLPSRTDNEIKNYWHTHLKKKQDTVNSSGDERAKNHEGSKHNGDAATSGLDYQKAYYDNRFKNATAGNSMTTTPQYNEEKSVHDDTEILSLTSIEKWLLDDPSAPFPHLVTAPAPVPLPQVFPGLAPATVPQAVSALAPVPGPQVFPAPAPARTPSKKWLLENTSAHIPSVFPVVVSSPVSQVSPPQLSAPVNQVLPAWAPAPHSDVPPAPAPSTALGHEGQGHIFNMFTSFRHA